MSVHLSLLYRHNVLCLYKSENIYMPSFYVSFCENASEIEVFDDEFHHIVNVFRHKKGAILPLINGKGLKAQGLILDIKKKSLVLQLTDFVFVKKSEIKVSCAFSLLKNKNDLLIIEKLTELGIEELFPMVTQNSVKLFNKNTLLKMRKTSISATKQCDNAWLPNIHEISKLSEVIEILKTLGYLPVIASEKKPEMTCHDITRYIQTHNINKICLLIGPEGGFDDSEFDLFDKNSLLQVALSKNILRAETAAICAISQIMGCLYSV